MLSHNDYIAFNYRFCKALPSNTSQHHRLILKDRLLINKSILCSSETLEQPCIMYMYKRGVAGPMQQMAADSKMEEYNLTITWAWAVLLPKTHYRQLQGATYIVKYTL